MPVDSFKRGPVHFLREHLERNSHVIVKKIIFLITNLICLTESLLFSSQEKHFLLSRRCRKEKEETASSTISDIQPTPLDT